MNEQLIKIEEYDFIEANAMIIKICEDKIKLTVEDINFILNLKEKELINTFFNEYSLFKRRDFLLIENFINKNLDNENKDFVSDLIYAGVDFGLDLDYKKIVSFLIIDKEDMNCFVLACLEYLRKNIKFLYIKELTKNLDYILENHQYHQNEQILASICLYRITNKNNYLDFVRERITNSIDNSIFVKNILKDEMYDEVYFNNFDIKMFKLL